MSFANPIYLALVLALVPILWFGWRRRNTVGHTQVQIHGNIRAIPLIGLDSHHTGCAAVDLVLHRHRRS